VGGFHSAGRIYSVDHGLMSQDVEMIFIHPLTKKPDSVIISWNHIDVKVEDEQGKWGKCISFPLPKKCSGLIGLTIAKEKRFKFSNQVMFLGLENNLEKFWMSVCHPTGKRDGEDTVIYTCSTTYGDCGWPIIEGSTVVGMHVGRLASAGSNVFLAMGKPHNLNG
jgi:hypothetical protein